MKPQVINGLTFEMAQTQVQGTKYKALNKFKQFTTPSFTYEDMDAEADIAIMKAWQTWKPEESKFNTYATNYINWMLYRALDTYNDVFKMNVKVKNDLKARGETYATLAKKKVTRILNSTKNSVWMVPRNLLANCSIPMFIALLRRPLVICM